MTGPTPGSINYGAPATPDQIARQAGFPTAAQPARTLAPRDELALPTNRPRINPATGTTELIPGGFDLIENLLKQMILPAPGPGPMPGGGVRG